MLPVRSLFNKLRGLSFGAAVAFVLLPAAVGQADVSVQPSNCSPASSSQVFSQWGDSTYYELVPGGDFAGNDAGWSSPWGVQLVSGSEPWNVSGASTPGSLQIANLARVDSPQACVNVANPAIRFFTRSDDPYAVLVVSSVLQSSSGQQQITPLAVVQTGRSWAPSNPIVLQPTLTPALNGQNVLVGLRFRSLLGSVQLDDVYIDPYNHCC